MSQAKKAMKATETAERLEHAKGLSSQGELHHLVEEDAAALWSGTVQQLPPDCLKCRPRYPPTQCQPRSLEEEGLSSECKLCGDRQTLSHVLNHCEVALELDMTVCWK